VMDEFTAYSSIYSLSIYLSIYYLYTGKTSLSGFPCVKEFVPLPNGGENTYLLSQLATDDYDNYDDDDDDYFFHVSSMLGHCPMDQIPDTVNREVLRFLSDIIL